MYQQRLDYCWLRGCVLPLTRDTGLRLLIYGILLSRGIAKVPRTSLADCDYNNSSACFAFNESVMSNEGGKHFLNAI